MRQNPTSPFCLKASPPRVESPVIMRILVSFMIIVFAVAQRAQQCAVVCFVVTTSASCLFCCHTFSSWCFTCWVVVILRETHFYLISDRLFLLSKLLLGLSVFAVENVLLLHIVCVYIYIYTYIYTYCNTLNYIVLYYMILYYIILYYIISYYIIVYYTRVRTAVTGRGVKNVP